MNQPGTITGRVTSIRYRKEDSGWTILSLASGDMFGTEITAVGTLSPEPYQDEQMTLQGRWKKHPKYGEQFEIERVQKRQPPLTRDGLAAYLGSGRFHGIGEVLARRIVDKFGADTARVLSDEPHRLAEVSGISATRATEIAQTWAAEEAAREIISYLCGLGLTVSMAAKIHMVYGKGTVAAIQENPYRLAWDVEGIGFLRADQIARAALNLPATSPYRIEAGLLHILQEARNSEGHVYLPEPDLVKRALALLKLADAGAIRDVLAGMSGRNEDGGQPALIAEARGLYLPRAHRAETGAATRVIDLLQDSSAWEHLTSETITEMLPAALAEMGIALSDEQTAAVRMALENKVAVITGGPGTGKCVSGNTLVWSERGLVTIDSLMTGEMLPDSSKEIALNVMTRTGLKAASHFYYGGKQDTLILKTHEGYTIEGTPNHRLIAASEDGAVWKRLDELTEGCYMAIYRHDPQYTFEFDAFAYFLGQFTGDGHKATKTGVIITTPDKETWTFLETEMRELGFSASFRLGHGCREYYIGKPRRNGFGGVVAEMQKWGCEGWNSKTKRIPARIGAGSYSQKRSYLMGVFDSDGHADKRGAIEITLTNHELIHELQVLLLQFGVVSQMAFKSYVNAWKLSITGRDAQLYYERVGFRLPRKQERQALLPEKRNPNLDVVPCLGSGLLRAYISQTGHHDRRWWWRWKREVKGVRQPSQDRISTLLKEYPVSSSESEALYSLCNPSLYWARVESIRTSSSAVYDLHVPDGNEFIANGFVNHNTTILRTIVSVCRSAGVSLGLCAPTGRAAKRMGEATGHGAGTIHRLLEFDPISGGFTRKANNPLTYELVIVDESSMLDLSLFHSLLQALKSGSHLLLVGDVDQLPSVGAGDVLRAMIDCGRVPVARLQHIYRQAEGSGIVVNAHRINTGRMPKLTDAEGDFILLERTPEQVAATVRALVTEWIPQRFNLDPMTGVQVLAPMYRGTAGVDTLNTWLQDALLPPALDRMEYQTKTRTFRVGDKVMQLVNDYKKDVFNGDIGYVRAIIPKGDDKGLIVDFDGREVKYAADELGDITLAYAVTVHKSQGGEFPIVILVVSKAHYIMLRRTLVYTGITRGKRAVILVGDKQALQIAVRNNTEARRYCALKERLQDE